jgi:chromosome segregation ATPase
MLAQEKENLRIKVNELNEEVDRLKDVEGKLAEKQKQMDTVMKEYKKRFNDELSERQKEIENNLRELYAEQDVASIAKRIEAAVSVERIRLEKEMAADFEKLNQEMREMSLSFKKTNQEIEKKKEELDKVKGRLKEAEDLAVKYKNEALAYKGQLQKMVSPKNVELKVKAALDSLSTILEMVQVAQNEMVSCYDILAKKGVEKPKLTPILNEIGEKKGKIEEFLRHIGKARAKIQEVIMA